MKKLIFTVITALMAGSLTAQTLTNGTFDGATGLIESAGVASPWIKGCTNNSGNYPTSNTPIVELQNGTNVVKLEGTYDPSYHYWNLHTVAQNVGPIPQGRYEITFKASRTHLTLGNPGIDLNVSLRSSSACLSATSYVLSERIVVNASGAMNEYTVTFCVPSDFNEQMNVIEFAAVPKDYNSFGDGVLRIDNVSLTNTTESFTTHFEYQIDCLTGQVQVRPTTAMNPNLHDVYIIVEDNPNEPYTQYTSQWFYYSSDPQEWYTITQALQPGKNYYIKRGVWGDCLPWNEHREYNVQLQPGEFNSTFTFDVNCNSEGEAILSVTGANQNGKNPHHMFTLYEHFPGTSNPDQALETVGYWSFPPTSPYQYQQGPLSFTQALDPTKSYYVKRGVWDACTPWAETRRYDIFGIPCPKSANGTVSAANNGIIDKTSIYPNPVKDVFSIETNTQFDEVEIYSIGGELINIYQERTIDVSNLENGYYLVKMVKDGNVLSTKRFTKQ